MPKVTLRVVCTSNSNSVASGLGELRAVARSEVARAIDEQQLTIGDLIEFIDLKDEFSWTLPLSRARAIEFLSTVVSPAREQQQQVADHQQGADHQQDAELVDSQPEVHLPEPASQLEMFDLAPFEHFGLESDRSHCSESTASESDDDQWWGGRPSRPG